MNHRCLINRFKKTTPAITLASAITLAMLAASAAPSLAFADTVERAEQPGASASAPLSGAESVKVLKTPTSASKAPKTFGILAEVSAESDFQSPDSSAHTADMVFSLRPSYQLTEHLRVGFEGVVTKGLTQKRETLVRDSALGLRLKPIQLGVTTRALSKLVAVIPTSEISRRQKSMIGALQITQAFDFRPANFKSLSFRYDFRARRDFYEYRVTTQGESNPSWGMANQLAAAWSPTDKLRVELQGGPDVRWTFDGTPRTGFAFNQEISYLVSDVFSVATGHTNEGNAFKENGRTGNISLFNGYSSTFYGTLTYTY